MIPLAMLVRLILSLYGVRIRSEVANCRFNGATLPLRIRIALKYRALNLALQTTVLFFEGLDICRTTGLGINGAQLLLLLAEAYGLSGHTVEGLRALEKALAAVEKTGERRDDPGVYCDYRKLRKLGRV